MELPIGVNKRYASFAGFILVALWCWVAFDRPYNFPTHISWDIYSNRPAAAPTVDVFDYPPVESTSIKKVCADAPFNQTLTFVCAGIQGDVTEVRNSILTCVRYAILAGADLVLPQIIMREDYANEHSANRTSLDYMFDMEYFVRNLNHLCPKMRLYGTMDDVMKRENVFGPMSFDPGSRAKLNATGQVEPEEWQTVFKKWLAKYSNPETGEHTVVELERSFLQYPIESDGEAFWSLFGKILKFGFDTGNMATITLLKLSEAFYHPFDISKPILQDLFLGVHLSTGPDPSVKTDKNNLQYKKQTKLYLDHARDSKFSTIYASSDVEEDLPQFFKDAEALNISVVTKFDLLRGKYRETLFDFTPDQQKAVDFLILTKASEFAGVGHSSFSWNVALRRHQLAKERNHLEGPQILSDDLSQIYGTPGTHQEFSRGMWP